MEKQLDDIERGIDDVQASKGEQFTVKQLMKTRKAIKTKLEKLNDTKRKDTVIDFEQLGVDRLFAKPDIDGGLVGGASLKPDFGKIVNYNK